MQYIGFKYFCEDCKRHVNRNFHVCVPRHAPRIYNLIKKEIKTSETKEEYLKIKKDKDK